jgi:hypothetical protein
MDPRDFPGWGADWAWGLPLIVLTVVLHAYALGHINNEVNSRLNRGEGRRRFSSAPNFIIGGTALAATILHGFEGGVWAAAYRFLGASTDNKSAMLYSLNALTSYGHADIHLASRWAMLGALEALNGWILFGITTAFLFSVVQKVWPLSKADRPADPIAAGQTVTSAN